MVVHIKPLTIGMEKEITTRGYSPETHSTPRFVDVQELLFWKLIQSRDWDFPLIAQLFDFVKGFKGRSSGRKVQDPVLSFFQHSSRIYREISGFDVNCIFCSLRFSVISLRFRLVSLYSNFPAAARVNIFVPGEKNCRNSSCWGYSLINTLKLTKKEHALSFSSFMQKG